MSASGAALLLVGTVRLAGLRGRGRSCLPLSPLRWLLGGFLCGLLDGFPCRRLRGFLRVRLRGLFSLERFSVRALAHAGQRGDVVLEVLLGGDAAHRLGDHVEGEVFHFLEPQAATGPGHLQVALLPGGLPRLVEPLALGLVLVEAEHVDDHVVLLRRQAHVHQRELGVGVVAVLPDTVRHAVADHAVLHALDEGFVEVFEDQFAH